MRLWSWGFAALAAVLAFWWYEQNDKPLPWSGQHSARPPITYGEWARKKAEECELTRGSGRWHDALGLPLKDFCAAYAQVEMQKQLCKDHPSKC